MIPDEAAIKVFLLSIEEPPNPTEEQLRRLRSNLKPIGLQDIFETPFGNFPKNATGTESYFSTYTAAQLAAGIPPPPTNLHRGMFRGPGYFGNDVQLAKAFGLPKLPVLGENARVDLQANFYNLFNKENLQPFGGQDGLVTIGGPQFGVAQAGLAGPDR